MAGEGMYWDTEKEKVFIKNIGNHTTSEDLRKIPKSTMLGRYLKAQMSRTAWGKIDQLAVISYARRLFEEAVEEEVGVVDVVPI